jgi:hypothetical protein
MHNDIDGIIREFRAEIEDASLRMLKITDQESATYPAPDKWSRKQIVGHLIDSAANNHQRFVRAQSKGDLVFQGYDQEAWVSVQDYQNESWTELVQLWRHYNLHIAHLISRIPVDTLKKLRHPHSLDQIAWKYVEKDQPTTIEYIFTDYIGHMKSHLDQIFRD